MSDPCSIDDAWVDDVENVSWVDINVDDIEENARRNRLTGVCGEIRTQSAMLLLLLKDTGVSPDQMVELRRQAQMLTDKVDASDNWPEVVHDMSNFLHGHAPLRGGLRRLVHQV